MFSLADHVGRVVHTGSVEQLNELSSSRGAMSMEAFRERALTTDEQAGQKERAAVRADKVAVVDPTAEPAAPAAPAVRHLSDPDPDT
eukprot:scaffold78035_cov62-Phaeocystis_antarctica.AAC.1